MSTVETLALTLGVGWAAGINLYAAVFMLGLMHNLGHVVLPGNLEVVADPFVMAAAGVMYCVEFFADKIPGFDSLWDGVHSFVRIPAGAVLAAQAVGDVSEPAMLGAGLLGGFFAAGSHTVKAGSRMLINASPEPFTNWTASVAEDVAVIGGVWAALTYPWVFLAGLVLFVCAAAWLLPRIVRGIRLLFAKLAGLLRGERRPASPELPDEAPRS